MVSAPDPAGQPPTAASMFAAAMASTSVQADSSTRIAAANSGSDKPTVTAKAMQATLCSERGPVPFMVAPREGFALNSTSIDVPRTSPKGGGLSC